MILKHHADIAVLGFYCVYRFVIEFDFAGYRMYQSGQCEQYCTFAASAGSKQRDQSAAWYSCCKFVNNKFIPVRYT